MFEHFSFEVLLEFDVFAPTKEGRTRDHKPWGMMHGFLHCYYRDISGIHPIVRELQKPLIWFSCDFDRPRLSTAVDHFLTDLEHVGDEVFDHRVEQVAAGDLLDATFCIDSTDAGGNDA